MIDIYIRYLKIIRKDGAFASRSRALFRRDASNLVTYVMRVFVMAESPRRPTFAFGLDDSSPRNTRNTGNTGFFTESVPLFIATGAT